MPAGGANALGGARQYLRELLCQGLGVRPAMLDVLVHAQSSSDAFAQHCTCAQQQYHKPNF